jgi:5-(carboxyamino)imidazole ribonucleotide synthase
MSLKPETREEALETGSYLINTDAFETRQHPEIVTEKMAAPIKTKSGESGSVTLPGSTIGILGGGQLGRMMALAGRNMGYRFVTLDPIEDAPCSQVADRQITASYEDRKAARELAHSADLITYEFENVNAEVTALLERESHVPQGSRLLYLTQHRIREKQAIEAAGVKVAPYRRVTTYPELLEAIEALGLPAVLKTVTGGYDGKGQRMIRNLEESKPAFTELSRIHHEFVLEAFVPFSKELSVIAARNQRGEIKVFPVAENTHVNHILHTSVVPARIPGDVLKKAEQIAMKLAGALELVGLLAVELFYTGDGELYVNELAPRPHNSGHYTMEACRTSQFEQHIRAICNLPLGSSDLISPVVMVNILGEHLQPLIQWISQADRLPADPDMEIKLHLYGKHETKQKRKMGHLNLIGASPEVCFSWMKKTGIWGQ